MKLLAIYFGIMLLPGVTWKSDFNAAKTEAVQKHEFILINFSGSDWCGPCIRLRREILESVTFENYASGHLVLVRADFPRQKKNQLSKEQTKLNETLADKYNADGKFPYTLLVDESGRVLKTWDGLPNETPDQFVSDISSLSESK